jgi:hypothetical protein
MSGDHATPCGLSKFAQTIIDMVGHIVVRFDEFNLE